ncbi:MAG: acyltransferase [Pseudomonadota bacterium]
MNRIALLDVLRFLAAFTVVLYHYSFYGYATNKTIGMEFQSLGSVFQYGHMGVELFFMISGFVILLSSENKTISHFIISRVTRLYPAYWVGVTLTTIVIVIYGSEMFNVSSYQYFINLTMINEMFHVRNIDGVYWTLFVEIRFYLLVFVLMLFRQMRFLKIYLLIWVIISILYHFIKLPNLINFFFISNVAPFFIAGAVFYIIYKNQKTLIFDYLILFLSFMSAIMYLNQKFLGMEEVFNLQFNSNVFLLILFSFYLIFYLLCKNILVIDKDKSTYKVLGEVTYPLYLIHATLGYIIFINLHAYFNKYILLISTIVFMIVISYLIHVIFERKLGRAMKKVMFHFVDHFTYRAKR